MSIPTTVDLVPYTFTILRPAPALQGSCDAAVPAISPLVRIDDDDGLLTLMRSTTAGGYAPADSLSAAVFPALPVSCGITVSSITQRGCLADAYDNRAVPFRTTCPCLWTVPALPTFRRC